MEHGHVLVLLFLFFSVWGWKLSKIPWMRLCGWKWKETKLTVLFGLARHSNKKNPAARKMFWKKDKFSIDLGCGVTRKACISEDLSDHPSMGYHRGKEENTSRLKNSFHFSTCTVIQIHKFLAFLLWPVSKWFYNLFLYTWCHLTEWSGSLFPDRMGYKSLGWGNRLPLQRRELVQLWKDHSRCEEDPAQQRSTVSAGNGNAYGRSVKGEHRN